MYIDYIMTKGVIIISYNISRTGCNIVDAGYIYWNFYFNKLVFHSTISDRELQNLVQHLVDVADEWGKAEKNRFTSYFFHTSFEYGAQKSVLQKKGVDLKKKYKERLENYIEAIKDVSNTPCIFCGRKEGSIKVTREHLVLAGSTGKRNSYWGWGDGIPSCGLCVLGMYTAPIVTINDAKKSAILIESPEEKVWSWWLAITQSKVSKNLGIVKNMPGPPIKGIFNFMNLSYDLALDVEDIGVDIEGGSDFKFLHFSNIGNDPFYNESIIPIETLLFLLKLNDANLKRVWNSYVYKFYRGSKFLFDNEKARYKEGEKEADETVYKNGYNRIINALLYCLPIRIKDLVDKNTGKLLLHNDIIDLYWQEVLKLREESLNVIKDLAYMYAECINEGKLKLFILKEIDFVR